MPNTWARDPRLKMSDKGALVYILSHAPGYRLTIEQMVEESGDGKDAITAMLRRLEDAGYITRTRTRNADGTLGAYDYVLSDPHAASAVHQVGLSQGGKTRAGRHQPEGRIRPDGDQDRKTRTGSDQAEHGVSAGHNHSGKSAVKEDHLEDQENSPSPTGLAAPNVGEIVASYVDYCSGVGIKLPGQVKARFGAEIKKLVGDGFTEQLIKRTLWHMIQDGRAANPALLPLRIVDQQQVPRSSAQGFKSSAEKAEDTREREAQLAAMLDELEEKLGRPLTFAEAQAVRAKVKSSPTGVHTCTVPGYIDGKVIGNQAQRPREVTAS